MALAYILNFIALKIAINSGVNAYLSQIISGAIYTISGFLFSKLFVFNKKFQ